MSTDLLDLAAARALVESKATEEGLDAFYLAAPALLLMMADRLEACRALAREWCNASDGRYYSGVALRDALALAEERQTSATEPVPPYDQIKPPAGWADDHSAFLKAARDRPDLLAAYQRIIARALALAPGEKP
ncbi:MAG: hypothetical protein GIW99_01850 [Candidatus Eremiobacteraeota bacterium]|nr:hypothetical protein [Candidatus Eremiobacteraeota bacterium]MBC5826419.1 hypothetical protein [Candidatus Eremiobacteraeota bacterium]